MQPAHIRKLNLTTENLLLPPSQISRSGVGTSYVRSSKRDIHFVNFSLSFGGHSG